MLGTLACGTASKQDEPVGLVQQFISIPLVYKVGEISCSHLFAVIVFAVGEPVQSKLPAY